MGVCALQTLGALVQCAQIRTTPTSVAIGNNRTVGAEHRLKRYVYIYIYIADGLNTDFLGV